MKNQNHRNKKKSNKVVTELDIESLQAELDVMKRKNKNNRRHYRKPNKRRADRR